MFFKKGQPSPTHDSPEKEGHGESTCSQIISLRSKQQKPLGLKLVASWFGPGNPSHIQPCQIVLEKPSGQASQVFFKEHSCKKEDWV
nr:uncharacterized protein LOC105726312 [Aotus nancymaae]